MAFHQALPWNEGEEKMHAMTKVPYQDNSMNPGLTARAARQISVYPLMALGTTDPNDDDRPWTTLWGGEPPMAQAIAAGGIIGIKAMVDSTFDPVINALLGKSDNGEVMKQSPNGGAMVSALSIGLEQRNRVKLYGRMIAGALSSDNITGAIDRESEDQGKAGNVQLVLKIEQSLGNCPKYLNKKVIEPYHDLKPQLVSTDIRLCEEAVVTIEKADMFFISSSHRFEDMDTNHRGGPPGFLRVQHPDNATSNQGTTLVWPEYSGNNLYQTLGNLMTTPRAGLAIPDYETGSILYLSGDTSILFNDEASTLIAKSKLAVRFTITRARLVRDGLGFRGKNVQDSNSGRSPYNPRVRYLKSEQTPVITEDQASTTAKLIQKQHLTPSITRYRFSLSDPSALGPWKPGQYVALDFSAELDMGYSHMRDDDPLSINDDFVRTFTVASPPGSLGIHGEEFDIIVRKAGSVTRWMTWQREGSVEVNVRGFAGEFRFGSTNDQNRKRGFVAAGVGITPLLGQRDNIENLILRWSVAIKDAGLVNYVLNLCSRNLKRNMVVYLTGTEEDLNEEGHKQLNQLLSSGIEIERRRITKEDLAELETQIDEYYLCTTPQMRETIQSYLPGKSIVFENFDY